MSASAVRGGQVYVEIGANPSKLLNALRIVNTQIGNLGSGLSSVGQTMAVAGGSPLMSGTQSPISEMTVSSSDMSGEETGGSRDNSHDDQLASQLASCRSIRTTSSSSNSSTFNRGEDTIRTARPSTWAQIVIP